MARSLSATRSCACICARGVGSAADSAAARVPSRCSAPPHAGADYANCNLTGVNFSGADLMDADFKNATLTGCHISPVPTFLVPR